MFGLLLIGSLGLSRNLGVVFEPEQLLGGGNPVARQYFAIEEAFGQAQTMMVVVSGSDREAMIAAAHETVARVRASDELNPLFTSINLESDASYPLQWGLMLADEIADIEDTQRLLEQRSVLGFLTTLNDTIEEVVLDNEEQFVTNQDQWAGLAALGGFERITLTLQDALADGDAAAGGNTARAETASRSLIEAMFAGEQYNWNPNQDMLTMTFLPSFDVLDLDALNTAVKGVDAIAQQVDAEMPGVSLGVGGELAWGVARHEGAGADTLYPTLVALGLIVVLFFFSFTRVRKMLLALVALVCGIILTMGAITITVGHVSLITSIFAVILMGLGIDFGIHLVSNYDDFRLQGLEPADAMRKAMVAGGTPIMLGGITTAVAFFSLILASAPAIKEFGIVAGMGVIITLITMLLLFPALLMSFGGKGELKRARWRPMINFSFMGKLGEGIDAHPYIAILLAVVLTVGAIFTIPRNVIDFDPMNNSPRSHPYTQTLQQVIDGMEVSPFISFSVTDDVEEARRLSEAFRRNPLVARVVSVADFLPPADEIPARLERIAAGGPAGPLGSRDAADLDTPEGQQAVRTTEHVELLAQELQRLEWNVIEFGDLAVAGMGEDNLVVRRRDAMIREILGAEVGSPGREVFQNAIAAITADPQTSAVRLAALDTAFAGQMRQQQGHMMVDRAPTSADLPDEYRSSLVSRDGSQFLITVVPTAETQDSSDTIYEFMTTLNAVDDGLTGSIPLYVALVDELFSEAAQAAVWVMLAVFILLFLIFRHISHVLLAFVMVILGIVWMFGILPLTGTHLALTAGLVFPLLIGIGTDDAMHILHRYNHEGGQIVPALRYSGKAVLLTTITTMLAFGSLAVVGEMATIAAIGWLLFVGFGTCFIATVVVLPACLSIGRRITGGKNEQDNTNQT